MIQDPSTHTIGEIVAEDYRTAAVLERHGLDFCCGGKRTLDEACRQRGIATSRVAAELNAIDRDDADDLETRLSDWPLEAVIDRIVTRHHSYVRAAIPVLTAHTGKLARVHGERRPELVQVAQIFTGIASGMTIHMAREEQVLFPYVRSLVEADRRGAPVDPSPFGTVENPIRMMEREHEEAGDAMDRIRDLTSGYQPPDTACTTYRVCFQELEEFARDLHRHVHLENHVLFPAALRLEAFLVTRGR